MPSTRGWRRRCDRAAEHKRDTILIHLSGEDGSGWTLLAVDRATRRYALGQARRPLDAAEEAFGGLGEE